MPRSAQTEAQLAALAAGIDRANRPSSLLIIPSVILAVAVMYSGASFRGMVSQRSIAQSQVKQIEDIRNLVTQIRLEESKGFDLAEIFPPSPFFGSQVGADSWRQPDIGFREPPVVSNPIPSQAVASPVIMRQDITCTVNNEPLDRIFDATDRTLSHESLKGRAFVSQAMLTPAASGWRATIRFTLYETK